MIILIGLNDDDMDLLDRTACPPNAHSGCTWLEHIFAQKILQSSGIEEPERGHCPLFLMHIL